MDDAVAGGSLNEVKRIVQQKKDDGVNDEMVVALVDRSIRRRANELGRNGGSTLVEESRKLFKIAIDLALEGLTSKSTPTSVMSDLLDMSCIPVCKQLFPLLEERTAELKMKAFDGANNNAVLRLCNDLLRKLSRCVETSFSGRINVFLSRFMPLNDKSALNIVGHYNTANVTKYETTEPESNTSLIPEDDEGADKKSKETIPVDHSLYSKFWQIQQFMCNPLSCYDVQQWKILQRDVNEVFALLAAHKLDRRSGYDEGEDKSRKRKAEGNKREEYYFAKYLTNPKLLHLQLSDGSFRRCFLVQSLVLFQFLLMTETKSKQKSTLSEEDRQWVKDKADKAHQLLKEISPKGSEFARSIQAILSRELKWSEWKNKSCPDLLSDAKEEKMRQFRRRPRTTFDPSVIDLGNGELSKLWENGKDILSACKKRRVTPGLVEMLQDPLLEMDPEQQVDEEYKSVRDNAFQWRAGRLLLSHNALLQAPIPPSVTVDMASFLEQSILGAAKNISELSDEVEKAEKGRKGLKKEKKEDDREENGEKEDENGVKKETEDEKDDDEEKSDENKEGTTNGLIFRESVCYIVAGEIEDVADKVIETLSLSIEKTKELAAEGKDKTEILQYLLMEWGVENGDDPQKMLDLFKTANIESITLHSLCMKTE
ncbi:thoc-1 [Pristionchus pacificus]|nr:thoc-1 [Pristionchus pacificus]